MKTFLTLLLTAIPIAAATSNPAETFKSKVAPILQNACTDCHGGNKPKASLNLEGSPDMDSLSTNYHHWFKVMEQIETGTMPPENEDPLDSKDRETLLSWIKQDLTELLAEHQRKEGRSRFRRLSRNEYANTIQDLFGIRPPVIRMMPGDGRVDGYDKVSKSLPFSPAATEAQIRIAEETIAQMFNHPQDKVTTRLWARPSGQSKGHILELPDGWWVSFNSDANSGQLGKENNGQHNGFPGPRKPGWHRIRMHMYAYQTNEPLPVGIYGGHVWAYPQILKLLKVVDAPPGKPAIVETDVYLRTNKNNDIPGSGIRLVPLGLGVPVPKNTQASIRGKGKPGLAIQWVDLEELEGTLPGQDLLFADLPADWFPGMKGAKQGRPSQLSQQQMEAVLRISFARIGLYLYRRNLTKSEIDQHVRNFMDSLYRRETLQKAFINEVTMLMTSPDFLCISDNPGPLTNYGIATRLSYFLWNSTPDAELLQVATSGNLKNPEVLRAQTDRLLNDPKSNRFVEDFLDQWLGLWGIENTTPDRDLYPEYDDELKISSTLESHATFRLMLDENKSVRDFVAPDWTMVNSRLAKVYKLDGVEGFSIRPVKLPENSPYGGFLTQAATMKVTANGTLTSPVKRGVWVSDRLLGITIPPPPPTINAVIPDTRGANTLREQLALHSEKGSCQTCHSRFDPYGFALESFDVMGNFRTNYRVPNPEKGKDKPKWLDGLPVDCTGITPDGRTFSDIRGLREFLAANPAQLARGVVRHMLTYATGEPTTPIDQPSIDAIVEMTAEDDYGLRSLIHALVQSEIFRHK
jgi:hypothetical protein